MPNEKVSWTLYEALSQSYNQILTYMDDKENFI